MNLFVLLLCLLLGAFARASTDNCIHRIIYLPELRADSDSSLVERAAESQYLIARYLDALPEVAIFSERLPRDIFIDDLKQNIGRERFDQLRATFPRGFPGNFSDYNVVQKAAIATAGAETLTLAFGKISMLHKIENHETARDQAELDSLALLEISDYFNNFPRQTRAVLLSRSPNEITPHPEIFPSECVVTPPDLKAFFTEPKLEN